MSIDQKVKIPVYSCTLATLSELTGKGYCSPVEGEICEVELHGALGACCYNGQNTIRHAKGELYCKAREVSPDAIVVEAKINLGKGHRKNQTVRTYYAVGTVVIPRGITPCSE